MARKRDRAASRDAGLYRLLLWLTLCGAGIAGGLLLGGLAVGSGLRGADEREASYAELSANPGASGTGSLPSLTCLDCPDSYGVAARLRTIRDDRRDGAFRELGAVEIEYPPAQETTDDYRYGGRFPDADLPDPVDRPSAVTAQMDDVPADLPAGEDYREDSALLEASPPSAAD